VSVPAPVPSALHVNDAAFTAARLLREAQGRGYAWHLMPKAAPAQDWTGPVGQVRRATIGGLWLARLARAAHSHDIVHIHSATTVPHVRPAARRFVLHCHGSDVRSAQYDPARGRAIRAALAEAEAVFYSTPDLAEHVLPHRGDARIMPVPIDLAALPQWQPRESPRRIVFASRWEGVKGLEAQLDTAQRLVHAVEGTAEVLGIDWGPAAAEAARRGVRLVPKMSHEAYLQFLAGAAVVVGQAAGILSSSELEALGIGAPVAVPASLPLYADSAPPVYGSDPESVTDVAVGLLSGTVAHDPARARAWVEEHHGVAQDVDLLADTYRDVMSSRR
jgi:hypothetical protein